MIPEGCATIEPCCERSYLLCADVAQAVAAALTTCQGEGCCEGLDVFVSHHEAVGPGHYVAAWMVREAYSDRLAIPQPTISVRYVEPGFPVIRNIGGRFVAPDAAEKDAAARHSYAHGDIMVDAIRTGGFSTSTHWRGCRNVRIDQRVPDRVQGGAGGWTVTATWTL